MSKVIISPALWHVTSPVETTIYQGPYLPKGAKSLSLLTVTALPASFSRKVLWSRRTKQLTVILLIDVSIKMEIDPVTKDNVFAKMLVESILLWILGSTVNCQLKICVINFSNNNILLICKALNKNIARHLNPAFSLEYLIIYLEIKFVNVLLFWRFPCCRQCVLKFKICNYFCIHIYCKKILWSR